jgi:hypothetical protein
MSLYTSSYGRYIHDALQSNAFVIAQLLRDLPADSPRWDARPDPKRFTLREMVAHLLEFDEVCRERFERMIREDKPELPNWDEDEAAKHYAKREAVHDLEVLQDSRRALAAWLEGLSDKEWQMTGSRPGVGTFSVGEGVALMLGHDAYHLRQAVEWLEATK